MQEITCPAVKASGPQRRTKDLRSVVLSVFVPLVAISPLPLHSYILDTLVKKFVGSRNDREIKKIQPLVAKINDLEPRLSSLTDDQLKAKTAEFKQRSENGESLEDLLPDAFAVVRETGKRALNMRHFDVQLIGGVVLHQGRISEMKTGEGKTLVATLPAYLNALEGKGVHVVTVNDYLARRDSEWMGRIYRFLGMSVGVIQHDLKDDERQIAYGSDITYGTNNEFGFDYIVDEKHKTVTLTESGTQKAEQLLLRHLNDGHIYDLENAHIKHHVDQALRAHCLFHLDVEYMVKDGEVVIVDEFTGRLMPGRRWSDGLHQAVEAKEHNSRHPEVKIERENQTLATVTFQNYFRKYKKLAGMTGTADTEAEEFAKIYNLDVMVIPPNRKLMRIENPDLVYRTETEKWDAIVAEILEEHQKGRPVLVGTVSIEKSEKLSTLLDRRGLKRGTTNGGGVDKNVVLNAKYHAQEAGT